MLQISYVFIYHCIIILLHFISTSIYNPTAFFFSLSRLCTLLENVFTSTVLLKSFIVILRLLNCHALINFDTFLEKLQYAETLWISSDSSTLSLKHAKLTELHFVIRVSLVPVPPAHPVQSGKTEGSWEDTETTDIQYHNTWGLLLTSAQMLAGKLV